MARVTERIKYQYKVHPIHIVIGISGLSVLCTTLFYLLLDFPEKLTEPFPHTLSEVSTHGNLPVNASSINGAVINAIPLDILWNSWWPISTLDERKKTVVISLKLKQKRKQIVTRRAVLQSQKTGESKRQKSDDIKVKSSLKAQKQTTVSKPREPTDFDPKLPLTYPFVWGTSPKTCISRPGKKLLVSIVHTARGHFLERDLIRQTWGSVKSFEDWDLRLVFIVGEKSVLESARTSARLEREHTKFNDIAKASFMDTYKNLTLKHAAAYSWILSYCPNASLVLKADDDFVIDVFKILKNDMQRKFNFQAQHSIWCRVYRKIKPQRQPKDKLYISKFQYPKSEYPPFCSGGAYLISVPTIRELRHVAEEERRIWLDDVLFTGVLVKKFNAKMKRKNTSIEFGQTPIQLIDLGEEYFYYHWESSNGMRAARGWYHNEKLLVSPWTFFLVQKKSKWVDEFKLIWKKILMVHS